MYAYMFVCMLFANIWRFKAPRESKVVPYMKKKHCLGMKLLGFGRCLTSAVARDLGFRRFSIC